MCTTVQCTLVHWTSNFLQGQKQTAMFNWSPCEENKIMILKKTKKKHKVKVQKNWGKKIILLKEGRKISLGCRED